MGKSFSTTSTSIVNEDKRFAFERGIGISGDGNSATFISADPEIVKDAMLAVNFNTASAMDTVNFTVANAMNTVAGASASNADGYKRLLGVTEGIFDKAAGMFTDQLRQSTEASISNMQAMNQAQANAMGALDQKTIAILGVAAAIAFAMNRRRS